MLKFEFNEIEEKRANDFKQWHKRCRPKSNDKYKQYAPFKYIITPTSIGVAIDIVCPYCNKIKDITDLDSW